jgi:hypothetical protein
MGRQRICPFHWTIRPIIYRVRQILTGSAPIHPKPILDAGNIHVSFLWKTLWGVSRVIPGPAHRTTSAMEKRCMPGAARRFERACMRGREAVPDSL